MSQRTDNRRKALRVELRCPALLRRDGDPVWRNGTWILNISCRGLYCSTQEPVARGEHLELKFLLPELADSRALELCCSVTVIRTQGTPGGFVGAGCAMDDYAIALAPAAPEQAQVAS